MRKPLTAVLGCGPTGMIAAHALAQRGVPFTIFSKKVKSVLGGAQYSHIQIPMDGDLADDDPEAKLTYRIDGDAETYHRKVYGSEPVPFVSISSRTDGEVVPAWNLRGLYDKLWAKYEAKVVDVELGPEQVRDLPAAFDLVLSSVPLPTICLGRVDPNIQHWFRSAPIRIKNEALDPSLPDNTIWYDGTGDHSWYRMSRIFGVGSTEWGGSAPVPPIGELKTVTKPIATNCDCHDLWTDDGEYPVGAVRIGRFGTWAKGELTYHAYNNVQDLLSRYGVR